MAHTSIDMKSTSHDSTASILNSVRRLSRGLRLSAQDTQALAGVSAAQLFVLQSLEDGAHASVSELAERTMTDRSSVASVVERLLQSKLVSRATAATDRRRAAISITVKGRAILKKAPKAPTTLLLEALQTLSARDLKLLADGLEKFIHALGYAAGPAYMLFEDKPQKAKRKSR